MAPEYAERLRLSRSILRMLARVLRCLLSCYVAGQSLALAGQRDSSLLEALLAIEGKRPHLCKSALDAESSRERISTLAAAVRARLDAGPRTAEAAVQALNGVILGPGGIRSSEDLHDSCNLLLSGVLGRKLGYCVGIAGVYLAVADELDLPIYGTGTPSHVFLRYDDGETRINIETFNSGAAISDEQYIAEQRIASISVRRGIFLGNLSRERFLAQVHNNLGVIQSVQRSFEEAASEYEEALRLDRRLPAVWYNLGKDLQEQGRLEEAVRAFSRALNLHPNDTWALNNRAMAYKALRRDADAKRDLEEALRIDPAFEQARANLDHLAVP